MGEFKYFLLNENSVYLGQKMGDILNAIQELSQEGDHMGKRQLVKHTENIVSMIRRILHSSWPKKNQQHLKGLQKVGVALAKAIEEEGQLSDILKSSDQELQSILNDMKVPIQQFVNSEKDNSDKMEKPEHKNKKIEPQQPPMDNQQPQMPPDQQQPPMEQQPPMPPSMPNGMQQMPQQQMQ